MAGASPCFASHIPNAACRTSTVQLPFHDAPRAWAIGACPCLQACVPATCRYRINAICEIFDRKPHLDYQSHLPVRQCVPAALTCLPPCRCTANELTRWRPRETQQGRWQPCRSGCRLGSAAGMLQPQPRRSCVWACCTTARCSQQGCPGSIVQDTTSPVASRATTTANACDGCWAMCCGPARVTSGTC